MATTYLAFLRAVNVGKRKVPMAQLKSCLTDLGLSGVRTYLASGNVFFESDEAPNAADIEACLKSEFGFEIPVILRTLQEIDEIINASPFEGHERDERSRFLITLAKGPISDDDLQERADCKIALRRQCEIASVIYLRDGQWPGKGAVRDGRNRPVSTSRFYHTLIKIANAARP